jgi:small subunit ribosomal protein S3
MPFRRVMKRSMERVMANEEVKGAKIILSGRLGGAEMARREWIKEGVMPRNTLRSHIDFSVQVAYTTYGIVGIRVWVYKGKKED